jgi:hypothetical protein
MEGAFNRKLRAEARRGKKKVTCDFNRDRSRLGDWFPADVN